MSNLAASPQAYRRTAVLAATRGELVVMLYDGARRFLGQAGAAMAEGDIERSHQTLRRAELIVAHLDGTLDHSQGEVADRLHAIYTYCLRRLLTARLDRDPAKLDEVCELLGELREAWAQVAREEGA
jgi:flagellar secretion chaperone FliS